LIWRIKLKTIKTLGENETNKKSKKEGPRWN
jgi:hypothetical protein